MQSFQSQMFTKTLVTYMKCFRCGREYPASANAYVCPICGAGNNSTDPGILDIHYDYEALRFVLKQTGKWMLVRQDMFRYLSLLPVEKPGSVLPVGGTPLLLVPRLAAHLGLQALYLKDETQNPTHCLKDRATAIATTMALAQGKRDIYCASAGNAAISLAGFCTYTKQNCHVFVPYGASSVQLAWLYHYGADVFVSSGNYDDAFNEAEEAGVKYGWYSRNCALNPYLVEGKKTVAFEIATQLNWKIPDIVVSPVGDGCTLGGVGKGFRELKEIGQTNSLPLLLGVQAEAIQPAVHRYNQHPLLHNHSGDSSTLASSIAVRRPRNILRLLSELEKCGGWMLSVSDEDMIVAQRMLTEEAGVEAELTSAATLAGLLKLSKRESLQGKTVVLIITAGKRDSIP